MHVYNKSYTIAHRGDRIEVKTNKAYVMMMLTECFLNPNTSTTLYAEAIIDAWRREPVTLQGWIGIFDLATETLGEKLSSEKKALS